MRKLKFFLAVVLLGVFGLLIYENRALFGQWYAFDFNLFFYEYKAPKLMVGVYFIAVFLLGFLIAYFSGLMEKYRLRRIIRSLENELASAGDTRRDFPEKPESEPSNKASEKPAVGNSESKTSA